MEIENEDEVTVHRKSKKRYISILSILTDFCDNAAFDGIQYLMDSRRHWIERVFWLIIIISSISFGSVMIYDTYIDWKEFPVIVSFSQKSIPVSMMPFPAVTICPQQKTEANVMNYTDIFYQFQDNCINSTEVCNVNETDREWFLSLAQVCDHLHSAELLSGINSSQKVDVVSILDELAPSVDETMFQCKWAHKFDCKPKFRKVITGSGVCYSFNLLNPDEMLRENHIFEDFYLDDEEKGPKANWNQEDGYEPGSGKDSYPLRVFGAGKDFGMVVGVYGFNENLDFLCNGPIHGYIVQLHSPDDFPQVHTINFLVPNDKHVSVSIQANMMTTKPNLKRYDPSVRQCFFNDERYLRYFKVYTQNNCEIECMANYTLKRCGCVKFSTPVSKGTPICTAADIECYTEAEAEIHMMELEETLSDGKHASELSDTHQSCRCLPACTSVWYTTDVSMAEPKFSQMAQALRFDEPDLKRIHISQMYLFFKHTELHPSTRSELYGITEFVANCGGLLGLFLGVSAVSIIELFYFCTLRLLGKRDNS